MTKKILTVILAALLLTALAAPALAEDDPTIRVSGNATVSLAADTAVVQVGVNTRKTSVQEAQSENAALMNAVIEAIKAVGQAGGYVYIMDLTGGIPYISSTLSTDVTAQVKAKLGLK